MNKSKEEALAFFSKEQVLLGAEQNKEEREHLLYVVAVAAGKILASTRPEAKKLAGYLPAHHNHQNGHLKPTPAITFILKPYPYQETKEKAVKINQSVLGYYLGMFPAPPITSYPYHYY